MPYVRKLTKRRTRRKTAKAKGRKVFKRRYHKPRYQKLTKQVARSTPIVADRYFTKLRYQVRQTKFLLSSVVLNGSAVLRGNSLFDPEFALGGGQPVGFDYIKTMYQFYKVHASHIRVRVFNNAGTNNGAPVYCTIYPSLIPQGPPTGSTQWMNVAGNPHAKSRLLNTSVIGNAWRNLSHRMKSKTVLGCKTISNTDHECGIAANPAENIVSAPRAWYWIVTLWNADQLSDNITYQVDMDITYMCEFTRPSTMVDATLFGDPDGVNDAPPNITGTYFTYEPTFGGSGSQATWVAGGGG